jgi:predicted TIM-barrel fold metal-dependent hydrolase
MKKIDFEAHFVTEEWLAKMFEKKGYPKYDGAVEPIGDVLLEKLLDLGEGRLRSMDENGIDMQVLSLTIPGVEQLDPRIGTALARNVNDALAEVIKSYPDRFLGFASLAPQSPGEAAEELERCVKELDLRGWKTHSNYGGSYLDDKKYWPIFERAAKLDVPVYLHIRPTRPSLS